MNNIINNAKFFNTKKQRFENIDLNLKKVKDKFVCLKNNFITRFNQNDKNLFTLEKNNKSVSMFFKDLSEKATYLKEKNKLKILSAMQNVDFEYSINKDKIKENIIINQPLDSYEFNFEYDVPSLTVKETDLGLDLIDSDGKRQFTIPNPFILDKSGNIDYSVKYIWNQQEDKLFLTVKADENYFKTASFPVIIDPQIIVIQNINYNIMVNQQNENREFVDITDENQSEIIAKYEDSYYNNRISRFTHTLLNLNDFMSSYNSFCQSAKIYLYVKSKNINEVYLNNVKYEITDSILVAELKDLFTDNNYILKISVDESIDHADDQYVIFEYNDNYPYVKIDYLNSLYTDAEIKKIDLAGGCTANVVLGTGENILTFNDLTDNAMGLTISHTFRYNRDYKEKGVGFKLNVNERFYKDSDGFYYYEDSLGDITKLENKFYYYSDASGKKEVVPDYTKISCDSNGNYFYKLSENVFKKVFKETFNAKGLKTIEFKDSQNIKYSFLSDKRTEEIKQIEESIKQYKNNVKDYVVLDFDTKTYTETDLESFEGYNVSAKKIVDLLDSLQEGKTVITLKSTAKEYVDLVNSTNYSDLNLKEQRIQSKKESLIKSQKSEVENFKLFYAEYFSLLQKYNKEKAQTAINLIQDGDIYKGFNYNGDLVCIFDKSNNYTIIEYDITNEKDVENYKRIKRIYNSENKQISFEYLQEKGLIKSITSSTGQKVEYQYNVNNKLMKVIYNGKENFSFTYTNDNLIESITDSEKLKTTITYSKQKVSSIKNTSLVSSISSSGDSGEAKDIINYNFAYTIANGMHSSCVVSYDDIREKFVLSENDNFLGALDEYYLEKNSKVIEAYSITRNYFSYTCNKIYKTAKKQILNLKALEDFTISEYDTYTEYLDRDYSYVLTKTTTSNTPLNSDGTFTENFTKLFNYDTKKEKILSTVLTRTINGKDSSNNNTTTVIKTITNYLYNSLGLLVKEESYVEGEESNGKSITEYLYSDKGFLLQEIQYNSLDPTSKFYENKEYDDKNQLIAEYNEFGNKKEYIYNKNSYLLEKEKNSDESEVVYGYDDNENLNSISITDENNVENKNEILYKYGVPISYKCGDREYYFTYDHKRRITGVNSNQYLSYFKSISDNVGQNKIITTTYEITKLYSEDRFVHEYFPDGRIKEERYIYKDHYSNPQIPTKVAYTYDSGAKINNITQIQDNYANITHDYVYDNLDRVIEHKQGLVKQNLQYSDTGEILEETYSYKNSLSDSEWSELYKNTYTYSSDSLKQLTSVTNYGSENYKYDKLGRRTKKLIPTLYGESIKELYGYYKNGDRATNIINEIKYYKEKELVRRELYTYDKNGNIISQNDNGRQVKAYTYDRVGRLIKEKDIDLNKEICYTYDEKGNILTKIVNDEETIFSYGKGSSNSYETTSENLVKVGNQSISYDFIGNPTSYLGANLTWTRLNLLNSYSKNGVTANFVYDKDKLLTKKTVGDVVTNYIWFDGKLIQEKTGDETIKYYYGADGLKGFSHSTKGNFYYRKNVLGDIIEIIDSFGTVKGKYSYTAFGECTILEDVNGIATANPFRYRGYYYDSTTNFYYLKSRYYDPVVCRFITFDDLQYLNPEHIGGLNLYAYCNNNPIMYVDPDGTWRLPKWLKSTLKVVAAVAVVAACTALTVVTGGTASVIFAGATIGGIAGGASAVVSTLISNGDIHDFANALFMGTITGAISGAVSASPLNVFGQAGVNALLGGVNYLGTQYLSGKNPTVEGLLFNVVLGGYSGFLCGKGWMNSNIRNSFLQILEKNAFKNVISYAGINSIFKMVGLPIASGILSGGFERLNIQKNSINLQIGVI